MLGALWVRCVATDELDVDSGALLVQDRHVVSRHKLCETKTLDEQRTGIVEMRSRHLLRSMMKFHRDSFFKPMCQRLERSPYETLAETRSYEALNRASEATCRQEVAQTTCRSTRTCLPLKGTFRQLADGLARNKPVFVTVGQAFWNKNEAWPGGGLADHEVVSSVESAIRDVFALALVRDLELRYQLDINRVVAPLCESNLESGQ